MSAFALLQTRFTTLELVLYVGGGLIIFMLIASLFRRRPPASQPHTRPSPSATSKDPGLEASIRAAERGILALAQATVASAGIFHFGAVDIYPKHLAYWITAPSDAERDRLAADTALREAFRRALSEAGYPAHTIPEVGFAFQSQETVDREYGGNWWYAVK